MRTIILSAILATVAATSFAAPSMAGGYGYDSGYGHRRHYQNDYGYEPTCFIKKIKRWDSYGNLIIKRIRVCN